MREYAILGSVVGVLACHGASGDAKRDSSARDTAIVAGSPAVTAAPSPSESIASRPRTSSKTGATGPDARTSPSAGSGTPPGGSQLAEKKVVGPVLVTPSEPTLFTDTVRGSVSVVGTDRDHRVMIARADGKRVSVTGPLAPLIGHVAGADVWVGGTTSGTSLQATRFIVKTVDGAPALDGTLKTEGTALYLVTTDGTRTRIVAPPPPLLGRDGARVWITGDPSRGVASFGFIDPPG